MEFKVAHLNPGVRGVASYALNMYNYFKDHDVDSLIVSSVKWTKQPIPVYEPDSRLVGGVLPWVKHVKDVEKRLLEYKPDILHHHHPVGRLDFSVERLRKKLDVPSLATFHMSVGSHRYFIDKVMHAFFVLAKGNFKNLDCWLAISQFVRKQLEEIGNVPKEKIVTLYAGVDPEIYKPVERPKRDHLEITFVGQLMPEKGIDGLVDAVIDLAKDRKVKLNVVGNGHLTPVLKQKAKHHPEINMVGFVNSPQKVAEYYATADVVVLPTRWDEAFSYIPLEALASGTPVIASRTGGNMEAIQENETGYFFSQGKFDELYEILKTLEPSRLHEMGAKGREYILKNHTLNSFGEKYHSLYLNLLRDPKNLKQID